MDKLDLNFMKFVMESKAFQEDAASRCKGTTSRARLNPKDFLKIELLLPPLSEQQKIVGILSSVDEAIQAAEAVIAQTRRVKEGLLQELLTKGIGHTRFKQTKIGEIPESWNLSTPGALATFTGGHGFRPPDWTDKGLPIIRIQNLNGKQEFNYFDGVPQEKWLVPPGTLLFAWAGTAGASFGPCLWPGPLGVLNQHIYKLKPHKNVNKIWLYEIMKLITSRIEKQAHGFKTTLLHVHKSDITGQLIPLPPYQEQENIAVRLEHLTETISAGADELRRLKQIKRGLLQDLLTGKVRVAV